MPDSSDEVTRVDTGRRYRRLGRLVDGEDEDEIGLIVDDRYRIEARIGRGGMGEVYRAWDLKLNRKVAVKVVTTRGQGSEGWRAIAERFRVEIEALSRLEHPGIVPIHDCGRFPDDRYYFTMQHVSGDTLERLMGVDTPERRLIGYLVDVCKIVHVAHQKRIVHRDLKPANVMIRDDGRVVVLDWGVAKVLGRSIPASRESGIEDTELTRTGDVIGTLAYMAPEQATGDQVQVDARSDVYSVGAILYQILTGVPPYRSGSIEGLIQMVRAGSLIPPSRRTPDRGIDSEIEALVLRAMAFEPADRYANALEISADLEAYLEGRPLRAVVYSPAHLAWKWVQRNRGMCAVISSLLLLGILFWGGRRWQESRERNRDFEIQMKEARSRYLSLGSLRDLFPREDTETVASEPLEDPEKTVRRQEAISFLLQVVTALDKANALRPGDSRARGLRIRMGLELGQLALVAGNDLLAERAFSELRAFGLASNEIGKWLERIERFRTATLRARKARLLQILQSFREESVVRRGDWIEDLIFEVARFRDLQTVEILEADLAPLLDRARAEGQRALWSQSERERVVFCCRVLGRLGRIESVPVLARWMEAVQDQDLLFEVARALCYTRRKEAYRPLLNLLSRFDSGFADFEALQPWLVLVPEDPEVSGQSTAQGALNRGRWFLARGELSAAIRFLSESIRMDSVNPESYWWRGIAYQKSGRVGEAIADFKTHQRLGSPEANVSNWLGILFNRQGKYREALQRFEEAARLDPGLAEAHMNSSVSYQGLGDSKRALAAIDQALEVQPDFPEAWVNRASLQLQGGKIEQALFDIGRALTLRPEMEMAYLLRAKIFLHRNQFEDARRSCEGVLRKRKGDLNHTRALVLRAQIWLASWQQEPVAEKIAKARTLLEQAIEQDAGFPDSYLIRGHVHRIEGRPKEAAQDYQRFLRLYPRSPDRVNLERYIKENRGK